MEAARTAAAELTTAAARLESAQVRWKLSVRTGEALMRRLETLREKNPDRSAAWLQKRIAMLERAEEEEEKLDALVLQRENEVQAAQSLLDGCQTNVKRLHGALLDLPRAIAFGREKSDL